jgi:2-polyprenyl-3-methyl-5-hydroxy-6-metoxy-1,4-benzoquinol methylase
VVPWGDQQLFACHRARYEFAADYVRGRRVLDIGCGEGYGSAMLSRSAPEVVGVDYSPAAISHARQAYQGQNLRFESGDARQLTFSSGAFDAVTCFEVIEHIEDDESLLASVARVLRPGGWLILSTPNALVDVLFDAVRKEKYEYHVNSLAPRELARRVGRHFCQVKLYGQSRRGNLLHALLKTADVLNLRHRFIRSFHFQSTVARTLMGQPDLSAASTLRDFRFTRMLIRQSPTLLLTARTRRP